MTKHYDLTPDEADVFFEEASELLESLDSDLVLLEYSDDDELVNRIFRAVHTLKGGAGSVGHEPMSLVAHAGETVLDKVRKHELNVTTEMVNVLFVMVDSFKAFLEDIVADRPSTVQVNSLVSQINQLLDAPVPVPVQDETPMPPLDEQAKMAIDAAVANQQNILVTYVSAQPDGVAPLARLLQAYMQIEQMGGHVIASTPSLPDIEAGQGSSTLVAVVVAEFLHTELEQELLSQVDDLHTVKVADMTNVSFMFTQAEEEAQEEQKALDNWLEDARTDAVSQQAEGGDEEASAALQNKAANRGGRTVRTSVERLDNLMNLAGELVTDRNRLFKIYEDLSAALSEEHLSVLNDTITHLSTITDQLHDEVVKARMQPIEYVFNKFPRLVRQIAQELGKQVDLVMKGQDTEVDRTVIEQVSDPLLHLVRNAIDHGIETVAEREAMGKPGIGRLELSARSEEGSIIITIADDGQGINGEKVKQKALAMGMITKDQAATMSYAEAIDLVFQPGLSTAHQVSDLSGRGVGMDVVRSNIQRINGSVTAHSVPGQGTTFELRLPLTLAIIPTLLVEVKDQVFALPLTNVLEIFKLDPDSINTVKQREAVYLRGEILPIFRMATIFGQQANLLDPQGQAAPEENKGEFVVSLNHRDTRFGVVVSRLLGKQDVVIKSLGYPINNIRGLSGATLLGDGRIGLIADVSALVEMSHARSLVLSHA
jgi:two-component system chemotaxis sensor kinase CheA